MGNRWQGSSRGLPYRPVLEPSPRIGDLAPPKLTTVPHRLTPVGATAAALVIANPHARRVRKGEWRKPAERTLGRRYGIEIISTGSADEAAEVVRGRMAAEQRPAVVVAAGGDGTVRLVAQELAGTGVPLGVIPLGTGNDFARANGIPDDVTGALDRIVRRSTRAIDLLEVNGRPFVTAGGIGIGAHSALVVPWIKALHPLARMAADSLGSGVYRIAAGANVLVRPGLAERVRLTWRVPGESSDQTLETRAHGVFLANQRTLGGGMSLPVPADNADGALDVCVVHDVARVRLLAALSRLLRGSAISSSVFSTWRAVRITIETERKSAFFGCGDLVADGTKFDVRVVPGALRVLV
jgi:diacylglycerol kinase (ATP)